MLTHPLTRPRLSAREAYHLVRERYAVSPAEVEPLPSDRDQNFLVQGEDTGRRYVLKVAHAEEDPRVLDLQNRIMEHLGRAGFSLSTVLRTTEGKEMVELPGPDGSLFRVRLLTWIPGVVLASVNPQAPFLFRSLGSFLGSMDRALEEFTHPAMNRELWWDLRHAGRVVRNHLADIPDPGRRALLEEVSQRFLERLGPLVPDLRMSVIQNDANDHNVLVSEGGRGVAPRDRKVVGVVDFGDTVRSFTVGEVAVACAYAMLEKPDPFPIAAEVVGGYHRAFPLRETEVEAVPPLMGLRLCQSVAVAAVQKAREPDNAYLAVSEAPAWELLERLERESLDLAHYLFRQSCGWDPVPRSGKVVSWLEEHGQSAAPVLGVDLKTVPVHVFDLSLESGEADLTSSPRDPAGWTRLFFGTLEELGAEVGVGRYDEVRRWYTSDLFQSQEGEAPEWRTVHIGVDLFKEPGWPVHAPFDAVVHSVRNNDALLDYGPTVILEHGVPANHGSAPGEDGSSKEGGTPESRGAPSPLRFWTLYGHLAADVLEDLSPGQPVAAGEPFARIGTYPTNGNWSPHLHFQIIIDTLGMEGDFPGVACPSQREIWTALCPDPNLVLGIPDPSLPAARRHPSLRSPSPDRPRPGRPSGVSLTPYRGHDVGEIMATRREHLGPNLSVSYRQPLKIVRGSRQFLYDHEGQAYLDCVNNVPHVGHSHPRVVEAARRQTAVLNTNTRYLHDLLVEYAQRLLSTLPDPLSVVYFVNSGSEANELALRMARAHTGRPDAVVVEGAYHGNTAAAVELSPYKFDGPGGKGASDWVHTTLMPDPYRGRFRARGNPGGEGIEIVPPDDVGARYGDHVREVLDRMEGRGRRPAAFFCEPLLGCGGQIVPPPGYMARAFKHVREAGGLCIADEVQVGFGRVGTHFWAFDAQGVVPDLVTLGKPMGNGHPLGAVVTTRDVADSFATGMEYFNTFGGNPVSCAVGLAVLDVMEEEGLQAHARKVGAVLSEGLLALMDEHSLIGDVRGLGLYVGVELVRDRTSRAPATDQARRMKERLRDHHLLLSTDGPDENVLKVKPPLVFTEADARRLVETLGKVLSEDEFQG